MQSQGSDIIGQFNNFVETEEEQPAFRNDPTFREGPPPPIRADSIRTSSKNQNSAKQEHEERTFINVREATDGWNLGGMGRYQESLQLHPEPQQEDQEDLDPDDIPEFVILPPRKARPLAVQSNVLMEFIPPQPSAPQIQQQAPSDLVAGGMSVTPISKPEVDLTKEAVDTPDLPPPTLGTQNSLYFRKTSTKKSADIMKQASVRYANTLVSDQNSEYKSEKMLETNRGLLPEAPPSQPTDLPDSSVYTPHPPTTEAPQEKQSQPQQQQPKKQKTVQWGSNVRNRSQSVDLFMAAANEKINDPNSKLAALAKFTEKGHLFHEMNNDNIQRNHSCMNVKVSGNTPNKSHEAINDYLMSQGEKPRARPPGRRKGSAMEDHPRSHEGFARRKKTFVQKEESEASPGLKKTKQNEFLPGYTAEDDLNGDGKIDHMEKYLKIQNLKTGIRNQMDDKIRDDYLRKFRKEVDFHHKVAYKFERAYRLGRKQPEKQLGLDMEIIEVVSEHCDYIEHDPMALFYCLYFCIYFRNESIVEFLRTLIQKMDDSICDPGVLYKIDTLLEQIDVNGIDRLRTVGEKLNIKIYHMVFYQAVDDQLRVVYSKILRKLKSIQLRDQDGRALLVTRDYELIREAFTKYTMKVWLDPELFVVEDNLVSFSYRQYNAAYFEEILLLFEVEQRIAGNYRERFLVEPEAIYQVLQMYSKKDFLDHFLLVDVGAVSHGQIIDLFLICIKNDSFKLALQIYLRYLKQSDITQAVMSRVLQSLRDSVKFHEEKLFLVHEHFSVLGIEQLNTLVDILLTVYFRKDYRMNPVLSQYNTVKISLLVYRISWRIEQQNIYSLITKCQLVNQYILSSLDGFLRHQHNVQQLYKLMMEPILNLQAQQDCMDIMLEMKMEGTLNNPIIVEVVNLVYEGQYSIDQPAFFLSQTFQSLLNLTIFDSKRICERLFQHVVSFGQTNQDKQTGLQFNIWKFCIEQRLMDEMLFTLMLCLAIIYFAIGILLDIDNLSSAMQAFFGRYAYDETYTLQQAREIDKIMFCPHAKRSLISLCYHADFFDKLMYFILFASAAGIVQQALIVRLKENAEIRTAKLIQESSIFVASCLYFWYVKTYDENPLIVEHCQDAIYLSDADKAKITCSYGLIAKGGQFWTYQSMVSIMVILFTLHSVMSLSRSERFGYIIITVSKMLEELGLFMSTFGALILIFFVVLRLAHEFILTGQVNLGEVFMEVFDGFVANTKQENYLVPGGQLYITIFSLISQAFLLSFIASMFVLRYLNVQSNIEAIRRMDRIKLKNSMGYDPQYGAITMTFFPINIIILPFLPMLLAFNSGRVNDFVLKFQYTLLILFYCLLGLIFAVPAIPLLYLKCLINELYISAKSRDRHFCMKIISFLRTLLLSPVIILLSLIIDLVGLNMQLMKNESRFEFKYQSHDYFQDVNQLKVARVFYSNFIDNYEKRFKGKGMTEIQITNLHQKVYLIIDIFHSLFCRGDRNYKESLGDIKAFNLSKQLTSHFSIPNKRGIKKLNYCDFDILSNILTDIIMFNYSQFCIDHKKRGVDLRLINNQIIVYAFPVRNYDLKRHVFLKTFHRDLTDLMNNFFVNAVALSFTDIEEQMKQYQEEHGFHNERKYNSEFEANKDTWKKLLILQAQQAMEDLDNKIIRVYEHQHGITRNRKKLNRNVSSMFRDKLSAFVDLA